MWLSGRLSRTGGGRWYGLEAEVAAISGMQYTADVLDMKHSYSYIIRQWWIIEIEGPKSPKSFEMFKRLYHVLSSVIINRLHT